MSDNVTNLITLREDYKFSDTTKLTWALARYYTNEKLPNFNADISSIIHPRHEYAKIKSTKHRNLDKIFSVISKNEEKLDLEYLPMTLYAMANVGFTDKEFYDGAILTMIPYTHSMLQPQDIGYTMQAMAMSGLAEYNGFFIDCLTSVISKLPNNQHFEFAFSQIISSVAQLNIDTSEVEDFTYHIGR